MLAPGFARSLVPKSTDLAEYLTEYNCDRAHTYGRPPADLIYGTPQTTTVR